MEKHNETKIFLLKYQEECRKTKRCEDRVAEIRSSAIHSNAIQDGMPRNKNRSEDLSQHMVTLEKETENCIKQQHNKTQICKKICDAIELLDRENEKDVLFLRYIKGQKWEEISDKMGFSLAHIHRIHASALNNLGEKINKPQNEIECDI